MDALLKDMARAELRAHRRGTRRGIPRGAPRHVEVYGVTKPAPAKQ